MAARLRRLCSSREVGGVPGHSGLAGEPHTGCHGAPGLSCVLGSTGHQAEPPRFPSLSFAHPPCALQPSRTREPTPSLSPGS